MRFMVVVLVLGAFLGGFAAGMVSPVIDSRPSVVAAVNQQLRFDSAQGRSLLEHGWGETKGWGTPLSGKRASVLVGFDGAARGPVELLIDGRIQGSAPQTLTVRFNDFELGRWKLSGGATYARRRFIIPKTVVDEDTVGHLRFEHAGDLDDPSSFGLVSLALRDLRPRPGKKGFVDSCRTDAIIGWAVADNVGSTVVAKVDGRPLPHSFTSAPRGDLAEHGLPRDAGFLLTPKQAIPAGATVEVEFFDGRPLRNSPCKI